jgi:hypothetical protein
LRLLATCALDWKTADAETSADFEILVSRSLKLDDFSAAARLSLAALLAAGVLIERSALKKQSLTQKQRLHRELGVER